MNALSRCIRTRSSNVVGVALAWLLIAVAVPVAPSASASEESLSDRFAAVMEHPDWRTLQANVLSDWRDAISRASAAEGPVAMRTVTAEEAVAANIASLTALANDPAGMFGELEQIPTVDPELYDAIYSAVTDPEFPALAQSRIQKINTTEFRAQVAALIADAPEAFPQVPVSYAMGPNPFKVVEFGLKQVAYTVIAGTAIAAACVGTVGLGCAAAAVGATAVYVGLTAANIDDLRDHIIATGTATSTSAVACGSPGACVAQGTASGGGFWDSSGHCFTFSVYTTRATYSSFYCTTVNFSQVAYSDGVSTYNWNTSVNAGSAVACATVVQSEISIGFTGGGVASSTAVASKPIATSCPGA